MPTKSEQLAAAKKSQGKIVAHITAPISKSAQLKAVKLKLKVKTDKS